MNLSKVKSALKGIAAGAVLVGLVAGVFALLGLAYALPVFYVTKYLGWGAGLVAIPFTVALCRLLFKPKFATVGELNAFAVVVYTVAFAGFLVGLIA